jgi:transposase
VADAHGIFSMIANWLDSLFGANTLDTMSNALVSGYGWAREWQVLLAGFLVLLAGLVIARAIRKTSASPAAKSSDRAAALMDLRQEPKAGNPPSSSGDRTVDLTANLVGELEQLRSLIRSALAAFTLTAEKENSPVQFLCQRVTRLRPERFPLSANAAKAQQETYAALLEQMEMLRQQVKKEAQPAEISGTLIKLNTSARSLVTALAPDSGNRKQAASDQR